MRHSYDVMTARKGASTIFRNWNSEIQELPSCKIQVDSETTLILFLPSSQMIFHAFREFKARIGLLTISCLIDK